MYKIVKLDQSLIEPLTHRNSHRSLPEGFYSFLREEISYVEPKIYSPYENPTGIVPRKVLLERFRKEFKKHDINRLFKQ